MNNKFISIKQWLFESKQKEQTFGCIMAEPSKIKDWEQIHLAGINENDLYEEVNDDSYGLEEQPHITVLYGIHENEVDPSVIVDMMEQKMEPFEAEISEIDIFENDKYDVVKYNVPITEQLQQYRDMFMDSFENTQKFKDYHPHITIAYVKSGQGKKYKKKLDEPFKIRFSKGVYSYHKHDYEEGDDLVRRVVNLEPEEQKMKDGIVKSKPFKRK